MKYITVTSPDINNGLGCRATLWVSGCNHRCPGCHNPESWDYTLGKNLEYAKDDVYKALSQPYIKGLTISGGDPLAQNDKSLYELYDFLKWVKEKFPEKDIWLFTGYKMEDVNENENMWRVLDFCDYVVDGPFIQSKRDTSLAFRGSSNQNIWKKENDEFEIVNLDIAK